MSATTMIEQGRRAHAALCIDTVTVTRPGVASFNGATGQYTDTPTAVYSGPGRVKRAISADTMAGDAQIQSIHPVLVLPYDAPGSANLLPSDRLTVNASSDATLVGTTHRIKSIDRGTTATAHRYLIEDVVP